MDHPGQEQFFDGEGNLRSFPALSPVRDDLTKWRIVIAAPVLLGAAAFLFFAYGQGSGQRNGGNAPLVASAPAAAAAAVSGSGVSLSGTASPAPAPSASAAAVPLPAATGTAARYTYSSIKTTEPIIAMTFDDGPHAVNTPKLLDMLAQRHIKATFFLIGENAARYPELVKRIAAEGHEIGNHTWTHPNLGILPDPKVRSEIGKTDDLLNSLLGHRPTLMRPPYGSLAQAQRRWVAHEFNYKIILWSVDPNDWKDPGSAVVAQRILGGVGKGSIILSHDIHAGTVAAMPQVLDTLLARGYKFMTVSELIAHDRPGLKTTPPAAAAPSPAH